MGFRGGVGRRWASLPMIFTRADDAGVRGIEGVDEGSVAGDPATLPTDLRDRVVVHVAGAGEDGVLRRGEARCASVTAARR